jgi:type 1 glutamine amidotransferase
MALVLGVFVAAQAEEPKKVLLVTTTTGFRHSSIPTAEKIIQKLAKESGAFTVDLCQQPPNQPKGPQLPKNPTPEQQAKYKEEQEKSKGAVEAWNAQMKKNLEMLSPESLKKYDGVIFANTTGDLPIPDKDAFIAWVKEGHGFVGMHSASDTYHGFRPYIEMLGGEFGGHGAQVHVDAINQDDKCPMCAHLQAKFGVFDEIYIIKSFDRTKMHGLLTLDAHPNTKAPGDFPIAWAKDFGKGHVFYTSLGHREDVWDEDAPGKRENTKEVSLAYQKHILNGIKWSLGLEKCDVTPQGK